MAARRSYKDEILTGVGYVVLADLLSAQQSREIRDLVLELAEEDRGHGRLTLEGKRERVNALVGRSHLLADLAAHPAVLSVAAEILGDDVTLGTFSAHILRPGAGPMPAHVDYPYWMMAAPLPARPALGVQAIWMVEDFGAQNGAPRFVPGSQVLCCHPDADRFAKGARKITGHAGSVVLSHSLCWHDTSPNEVDVPRVSLLGQYLPPFIVPQRDELRAVPADVLERADPVLRRLLGLDLEGARGRALAQRKRERTRGTLGS